MSFKEITETALTLAAMEKIAIYLDGDDCEKVTDVIVSLIKDAYKMGYAARIIELKDGENLN